MQVSEDERCEHAETATRTETTSHLLATTLPWGRGIEGRLPNARRGYRWK